MKIVKLTEQDLNRIVRRVIKEQRLLNESTLNKREILSAKNKLSGCFNTDKYPELSKIAKGSLDTIFGLILLSAGISGELFSFGLSTPASIAVGGAGATKTTLGILELKKVFNENKDKPLIQKELEELKKCLSSFF